MDGDWIHQIVTGFFIGFGLAAGFSLFNGILTLFARTRVVAK
jgi:hypothetical protein